MSTTVRTLRAARIHARVMKEMIEGRRFWQCPPMEFSEEFVHQPLIVRKARALEKMLTEMPIAIREEELFAGTMVIPGDPPMKVGGSFPNYATEEERAAAAKQGLSIHSVFGHIVPDYWRLLEKGLGGIRRDAEAKLAELDAGLVPSSKLDTAESSELNPVWKRAQAPPEARAFLQAVILSGEAVVKFAHRHAELAERLAVETTNPQQRREFLQIAVHCRHVPENPPRTFYEALQSFWFLHLVFHCTMDNLACGRFDQYMYPFFQRDVERGNLTLNAAQEMLDCLFLKFNERAESNRDEIESRVDLEKCEREMEEAWARRGAFGSGQKLMARDRIDATNHWLQNILVGGLKPDGADGTNELTFLCLEAYRRNEMTNPVMTVRLHRHSPDALVRKACEVIRQGGGMPAIFNDEALIPAIEAMGIPVEDARDYCNDGCWETIIAGKTDFRFTRFGLLRCLEWALNRGVSRVDGKKESIDSGGPRTFKTFDDVMNAFKAQLDYQMQGIVTQRAERWTDRACIAPVPLLSSLLDGPVESATDMTAGGAKYITFGIIGDGGAHAFDSLAAMKKVIFDDGAATMSELIDALDNNFADRPDLRRKLLDAPKYGNDDDYADAIARECIAYFTERVRHYAQQYPTMKFPTGVGTFSWYVAIGGGLGASPDGRLFAEPVSSNFSPALGADVNGPCAAVKSHAKMEMMNLPVGSPLDLRLDTKLVAGEEGLQRLTAFVRSFIECGGNMMTMTVTDNETLRKAQREPENYRNLRVRMGGWSAYFTALSKEQQEHHIRRQGGR